MTEMQAGELRPCRDCGVDVPRSRGICIPCDRVRRAQTKAQGPRELPLELREMLARITRDVGVPWPARDVGFIINLCSQKYGILEKEIMTYAKRQGYFEELRDDQLTCPFDKRSKR